MNKNIISSTLPLVVTILLFIIVGKFGIGRIQSLRAQISQAEIDKATLSQKLSTLESLSSVVGTGSQSATSALPEKNSALLELSQLRAIASQNGVIISNLKSGAEAKSSGDLSKASLTFDVTGARVGVITFLDSIQKSAPISIIDRIRLNEVGGETHATLTVSSFSALFPKSIPSVSGSVSDLTQAEIATLKSISSLIQPQFVELPVGESGGKPDPFAP
jgi:hypothetical protein